MNNHIKIAIKSQTCFLVKHFLMILSFVIFTNCDNNQNTIALYAKIHDGPVFKALEKSIDSIYSEVFIERILFEKMHDTDFELDTGVAYIKIGKFLNMGKSNAIVIRFSETNSLTLYELRDNNWELIFQQDDIGLCRAYPVESYIEDYNFDGINDIGIQNEISNGASIRTFHLWLSEGKMFKSIPEFTQVGNPVLLKSSKSIHGYRACCAFSEIWLSEYKWSETSLINTRELLITNYPPGIGAVIKNMKTNNERKVQVSKDELLLIDSIYDWNG